jgi:hypothetical protein
MNFKLFLVFYVDCFLKKNCSIYLINSLAFLSIITDPYFLDLSNPLFYWNKHKKTFNVILISHLKKEFL